jgi:hypothetical protein
MSHYHPIKYLPLRYRVIIVKETWIYSRRYIKLPADLLVLIDVDAFDVNDRIMLLSSEHTVASFAQSHWHPALEITTGGTVSLAAARRSPSPILPVRNWRRLARQYIFYFALDCTIERTPSLGVACVFVDLPPATVRSHTHSVPRVWCHRQRL